MAMSDSQTVPLKTLSDQGYDLYINDYNFEKNSIVVFTTVLRAFLLMQELSYETLLIR